VNHDKKATNRNKLLEEILTPHICGSSWTIFTPTPQDVVVSRVMGIATAFRTTPYLGWFFCLHLAIYTDAVLVIKATRPKLGQLWSRTHGPCESQLPSIDST
jgi:hypothetical protein